MIYLRDPEGLCREGIGVPVHAFELMALMDGSLSHEGLCEAYRERTGLTIDRGQVEELVGSLDEALLLDSDRFRLHREDRIKNFVESETRPAAHAGASYPADPVELKALIDGFFEDPSGRGRLDGAGGQNGHSRVLSGLIAPHIDFGRGGPAFAWAYRQLAESPRADVYVVLGTGHQSRTLYSTSRKTFETPFGPLRADGRLIDAIVERTFLDLFADEYAHHSEHSIEFQAVFLKYLFPDDDVTFVPILCGSFHEAVVSDLSPSLLPGVEEMVTALREAIREDGRDVTVISGVDFSHVGRKFGDEEPLDDAFVARVEQADRELIDAAGSGDPERFFACIRGEGDRNRVCGTSSIYTMLKVLDGTEGSLLTYDHTIDEERHSMVSFASMVFQRTGD
tara:strand:+ start:5434 stop:6618 length:1185 start_codon:yes stop_codon:yes gene_type:complete